MLNSLLLFGGSFGKNKKISKLISLILIINLLIVQLGKVNILFTIFNISIMFCLTYFIRNISNQKVNAITSVLSILIWSILIDLVSYYFFPFFNNVSILQYLINGLLFNLRYVFVNIGILFAVEIISYFRKTKKTINKRVLEKLGC